MPLSGLPCLPHRRKENDLSLEAFRDFLLKKGHKVD